MEADIHEAQLQELFRDPAGPIGTIMQRATMRVENRAKLNLLEPGGGRTYDQLFRYRHAEDGMHLVTFGSRPAHTASAPEQPAASDTGILAASVTHRVEETEDGLVGHVGSPLKEAIFTELGTREVPPPGPGEPGHHGMIERPWLRPALDELNGAVIS